MRDNRFIYSMKFIACLFVITIHAPFDGVFGDITGCISKFAVPFFFAVSGRFLLTNHDNVYEVITDTDAVRRKVTASLIKLIRMTGIVYLVHLVYSLVMHLAYGSTFTEWLTMKFNPFEAGVFFLFNSGRFIYDDSYVFDHMWYLFALIYVYVLIIIFAPVLRKWYKALIVLLLGLLFFGELLQTYYPIRPFDISITTWYIMRNWLFVGMPFVLIGIVFADTTSRLRRQKGCNGYAEMFDNLKISGLLQVAGGIVLSFLERTFIDRKEVYLGSVLIVIGLLILSEAYEVSGRILPVLGKRASSKIYFYHVLVISILDVLSQNGIIPQYTMWQKPILVMIICVLIFGTKPVTDTMKGRG